MWRSGICDESIFDPRCPSWLEDERGTSNSKSNPAPGPLVSGFLVGPCPGLLGLGWRVVSLQISPWGDNKIVSH